MVPLAGNSFDTRLDRPLIHLCHHVKFCELQNLGSLNYMELKKSPAFPVPSSATTASIASSSQLPPPRRSLCFIRQNSRGSRFVYAYSQLSLVLSLLPLR